ncbi:CBS domain-containing protein [Cyclobacterium amurskyense]|mgnify:CR=1 FL=1|jgi:predicted transcriptional regulator|uniref:CBS domain containing protein n=1 Tax=Cyclobacterium amurskyense TaxID=320787 RepID=A0A0H4PDJ3_9BACT|nr:CBS domain-containing protein [Cyclobacterium amurskyense]AKP51195.1 CBS domain containing protein [Cyclobacterium amurskyense]|tara:strand:+ start:3454 stop:4119 length:666 start_codon:yes stop_codon:yes gene_type:complete
MRAIEFINNLIPPLKFTDKVKLGLSWMEEIRTDILPVVDKGAFKGFITDEIIYELNDPELNIEYIDLIGTASIVQEDRHIYEVLRVSSENQVSMVAVLDKELKYLGVVTQEGAISAFTESISIQSQGGVLILSMFMTDYSLYDIARVVESENAKILSSFISDDPLDDSKIKVTLKIDQVELRHIKATLERFGYRVIDQYQEEDGISSDQDRLGNLMRFLDI